MVTPRGDEDIEKGKFNTAVQKPEYNEARQDGGTRERIVWQQEQPEHMHTL